MLLSLFIESCKFEHHTETITTMPMLMLYIYFIRVVYISFRHGQLVVISCMVGFARTWWMRYAISSHVFFMFAYQRGQASTNRFINMKKFRFIRATRLWLLNVCGKDCKNFFFNCATPSFSTVRHGFPTVRQCQSIPNLSLHIRWHRSNYSLQ